MIYGVIGQVGEWELGEERVRGRRGEVSGRRAWKLMDFYLIRFHLRPDRPAGRRRRKFLCN